MRVLFISDLHLQAERPDISRAFVHFLEHSAPGADQLYLLGDIFEAWIGDDAAPLVCDELISTALTRLKALSDAGTEIFFQHGNRDFLVGEQFAQQIGARLLPEQLTVSLPCGEAVILHGDQLCLEDTEYLAFRAQVRAPQWQQAFLSKSIEERLAIARQLRDASKARGAEKAQQAESIMDVTPSAVADTLGAAGVELMIHGHTHRPAIHQDQLGEGKGVRVVLGDWDTFGWYLECDSDGYRLEKFAI